MSYEKQDFTDNTVLTAAQLNHMEEGIAAAEELAGKAGTDLTIGTVTTGDRAAASIEDGEAEPYPAPGREGRQRHCRLGPHPRAVRCGGRRRGE